VKATIIVLSTAAFIAVAPVALAQDVSGKTPGLQHEVSKKHHPRIASYAPPREMQARPKKGYRGAFASAPEVSDKETEMSRQAGGGGM
jgi:hypothetical protein